MTVPVGLRRYTRTSVSGARIGSHDRADHVEHLEGGEVETHAEREDGNRGQRERRRPAQQAGGEPQILREPIEPGPAPLVGRLLA